MTNPVEPDEKAACPRCGTRDAEVFANDGWFTVECNNCPCRTSGADRTAADAVAAWNRRAALPPAPVAWIVGRPTRDGSTAMCLPFLRGREEMERYQRNNPDEMLIPLYTHPATVTPEGEGEYVLVPREPLPEMLGAFWRQKNNGTQRIGPPIAGDFIDHSDSAAYRAMLAAAPPSPSAKPAEGVREALHAFNECCDYLTNDIQRMRNVRDGIGSSPSMYVKDMEASLEEILALVRPACKYLAALSSPQGTGRDAVLEELTRIQAHAATGEEATIEMPTEVRALFTNIVEFSIKARRALKSSPATEGGANG